MKHDPPLEPDADLRGSDWARTTEALRRVARSVGASGAEADDVAQGALLEGLLQRARGLKPGFGWLKTQARHRTIDRLRRNGQDGRSQSEAGLKEARAGEPAPPEIAAQFEVQRRVMAAVEALAEPYRTTVFLRYFEGLSVPEIARRKAAPVPTVRTWLTRAHARLRETLLESDEGRSPAWIAAFIEFGRLPGGPALPPTLTVNPRSIPPTESLLAASLLMSLKSYLVAIGVLVALGLGYRLTSEEAATESPRLVLPGAAAPEPEPVPEPNVADVDEARLREAQPTDEAPSPPSPMRTAAPKLMRVHGRVLDERGQPLAGFAVRLEPPLPGLSELTTSSNGRFSATASFDEGLRVEAVPAVEGFVSLFNRSFGEGSESEQGAMLAVAPGRSLRGIVQGAQGEIVEGASILLELPDGFSARFDEGVGGAGLLERWSTYSSDSGGFELVSAPSMAGCSLTVAAAGYQTSVINSLEDAGQRLDSEPRMIVLKPLHDLGTVQGLVLDTDGQAVPQAWVALGDSVKRADRQGRFQFAFENDSRARSGPRRLMASANGWASVEFSPELRSGAASWPEYVELRLSQKALTIEGVVLDSAGEPAAGHYVWIDDMTRMGATENGREFATEALGAYVYGLHKRYTTDDHGRFQIRDLSLRDYTLVAMDPDTLLTAPKTAVTAGDPSAVIRYDANAPALDLAGRVVDRSGDPVEGASLSWGRVTVRIGTLVSPVSTEPIITGKDGAFELTGIPLDPEVRLTISGSGYFPDRMEVTSIAPPHGDLVFTLGTLCEVKVFTAFDGSNTVSSFELRNAQGEAMELSYSPQPGSYSGGHTVPLVDGVSFPFKASDATTEIVFFSAAGETLATQALRLVPGVLNEVRR